MTLREFIEYLETAHRDDMDAEVYLASDEEGNGFYPVTGTGSEFFDPEDSGGGVSFFYNGQESDEIDMETLTAEDKAKILEENSGLVLAVVLWP